MNKLLNRAAIIGMITSASLFPASYADISANTLPSFNNGTNVDVTSNGNNMNIKITGGTKSVGTANWNSFNIGKDAHVNVEFTAPNQTSLNRVSASGGLSQIYGKFTNSSTYSQGYESTGKVILLNPNGVLFGNGANVNLNSFTVSTLDGKYDEKNKALILKASSSDKNSGITVEKGAEIHGDKGVLFASDNINVYSGSKISTNLSNSWANGGKVKLITSDGVTFSYLSNGKLRKASKPYKSDKTMHINIQGTVISNDTEIINASLNNKSTVNTEGMNKKATSMVQTSDGDIILTEDKAITKPEVYEHEIVTSGMLVSEEPKVEPVEVVEVSSGMLVPEEPVIEKPEVVEVSSGMLVPEDTQVKQPVVTDVIKGETVSEELKKTAKAKAIEIFIPF